MIDAVLLAGGRGTRLCSDLPKPLAKLFDRPIISHQIEYLETYPIVGRIIVSLGYNADMVKDYLRRSHPNSNIAISTEEQPLGTGGALRKALGMAQTPFVLVLNVDNISDIDINALARARESSIVISKGARHSPYGRVDVEEGYCRFQEKPPIEYWTSTGWYIFEKEQILRSLPLKGSLEIDVLPKMKIRPFRHTGNIWSLNSMKDIEALEKSAIAGWAV